MFSAYKNIWFCGLAASGKTTVLRLMNEKFKDIEFLNDSLEMIEFIKKDINQEHHVKPTPDTFILKDSAPVYHSVKSLIKKAQSSQNKKIIELSRGHDKNEVVDFSYEYLFSELPDNLKKDSLFVYLYSPAKDRKMRNSKRPKLSKDATVFESFFCPDEAFERFFIEDDFFNAIKKYPVNFLFIPNIYSLEYLKEKVEQIFKGTE